MHEKSSHSNFDSRIPIIIEKRKKSTHQVSTLSVRSHPPPECARRETSSEGNPIMKESKFTSSLPWLFDALLNLMWAKQVTHDQADLV